VKAAGGVRQLPEVLDYLKAGATRFGSTCTDKFVAEFKALTAEERAGFSAICLRRSDQAQRPKRHTKEEQMLRREFMGALPRRRFRRSRRSADGTDQKTRLKITVLRKTLNTDLHQKYRNSPGQVCSLFEEGQEFILDSPYGPPKDFCQWPGRTSGTTASMFGGFKYGSDVFVACCTDGFRPVLSRSRESNRPRAA